MKFPLSSCCYRTSKSEYITELLEAVHKLNTDFYLFDHLRVQQIYTEINISFKN